jgi:hypothetical protein
MLFQCSLKIDETAKSEEVYTALVDAFSKVLKSYEDMPLKDSVTFMSDVLTMPSADGKSRKIAGRWQIDRRAD